MNTDNRQERGEIDPVTGLRWERRVPLVDKSRGSTGGTGKEAAGPGKKQQKVSREAEDLLICAKRAPFRSITELYADTGLSGYKGDKSKKALLRAGFAREVEVPTNRRGRRKKLLEVAPKGNEYLKSLGVDVKAKGRGGAVHRFFQEMVKEWYEGHGRSVEIEATVGDTAFDVLAIDENGKRTGIEIACSAQYEDVNLKKALASGVEDVVFVCETKDIRDRLRNMLGALGSRSDGPRVKLKLVSEYEK